MSNQTHNKYSLGSLNTNMKLSSPNKQNNYNSGILNIDEIEESLTQFENISRSSMSSLFKKKNRNTSNSKYSPFKSKDDYTPTK